MDTSRLARRAALLAIAVGAALALTATASGSAPPAPRVLSIGCISTSAPGGKPHGRCTYVLSDGRRFDCPLAFSNRHQTPRSLEQARACHALAPIRIKPAWRRVFAHLYAVQACLKRRGITARGGPVLDIADPRRTPIGELDLFKPTLSAFIAFYTTAHVAKRAEPHVVSTLGRIGGRVERRGSVIVAWSKPPAAPFDATTGACAFS